MCTLRNKGTDLFLETFIIRSAFVGMLCSLRLNSLIFFINYVYFSVAEFIIYPSDWLCLLFLFIDWKIKETIN